MPTARCDGVIVTDVNGVPSCEDLQGAPLAWVQVEPFSLDQIDPEVAGEHFALGFVLYGTAWAIGKGAAMVVNAIKLL
ncbi:MAG: hypothetical protein AAGF72_13085 [Pseudomonadota bacterium]